jgi:hypothetical protein
MVRMDDMRQGLNRFHPRMKHPLGTNAPKKAESGKSAVRSWQCRSASLGESARGGRSQTRPSRFLIVTDVTRPPTRAASHLFAGGPNESRSGKTFFH